MKQHYVQNAHHDIYFQFFFLFNLYFLSKPEWMPTNNGINEVHCSVCVREIM